MEQQPIANALLFFAIWPRLAACLVFYRLRDLDTCWTSNDRRK